jgi:cysteinyl-tRNA synthetase
MSTALLGEHFDIHGGGMDLKFPHHENEIAQTCGATGTAFVNVWMHNGFVNIDNEKMSKSLGNFFVLREVLAQVRHPEVMRWFLLASHYRGPINYSRVQLEQADAALTRLYTALRGVVVAPVVPRTAATEQFEAVMDDDFNTPEAFAVLQGLARELNAARAAGNEPVAASVAAELRHLGGVLGFLQQDPEAWARGGAAMGDGLSDDAIAARIEARLAARRNRDYAGADRIRDELAAQGIVLEDQPGGRTSWRRR